MTVYGLWHGGASYAPSGLEHLERFGSIAEAKRELGEREGSRGPHHFDFVNREPEATETPCVEGSSMWLFFALPEGPDPYPDRILTIGPREGVRMENV